MMGSHGRNEITVTVSKAELLAKIRENRVKHEQNFSRAHAGYQKSLLEALEAALAAVKSSQKPNLQAIRGLAEPTSHTKQYDRAIGMLEMSVGDTMVITSQMYDQYVNDEWEWSGQFHAVSAAYIGDDD